ncbi:MAG: hypothetical protein C4297_05865 [Gemmataceae bacterium]
MRTATAVVAVSSLALWALWPQSARPQIGDRIDRAVSFGVRYLRTMQSPQGVWAAYPESSGGIVSPVDVGATALTAIALIECGVPRGDPQVQRAAQLVRAWFPGLNETYAVSLALMFLDLLGDKQDQGRITALAKRLIGAQMPNGLWSYNTPLERGAAGFFPGGGPGMPLTPQTGGFGGPVELGDHSNSQFAILALWIARRHGVNTDAALQRAEQSFRAAQIADGGWSYRPNERLSTPSMTCAGLLALAIGHGLHKEREAQLRSGDLDRPDRLNAFEFARRQGPKKDPQILAALNFLVKHVPDPQQVLASPASFSLEKHQPGDLYYLWSLERVAVAYGWKEIGGRDWYEGGALIMLSHQSRDGSWRGSYPGPVDTSFALLFLRQANLLLDLSDRLQGATLRGGRDLRQALSGDEEKKKKTAADKKDDRSDSIARIPDEPPAELPAAPDKVAEEAGKQIKTAMELAKQLVSAGGVQQLEVLQRLQDTPGAENTLALALAIPELSGPMRERVRQALVERLSRMKLSTLRTYLNHEDAELRRAAAVAAALKERLELIPELISLLLDPEEAVVEAAWHSLRALTARDFGPPRNATRAERQTAVKAWRAWWETVQKERAP